MSKPVEFFYDYVSVYSYLANARLRQLKIDVRYRPMFLGGVLQATGNVPPATIKPKGDYLFKDVARWAKRYRVPMTMNPLFPQNTINAMRVAIVAQQRNELAAIHDPLFAAMWIERRDISDAGTLMSLISDAGLDSAVYAKAIAEPSVKEELKANTEEAVTRGVFGAPTFFVGEEMFFGNDRIDFVLEAMAD